MATSERPGISQEQVEARQRAESQEMHAPRVTPEDQNYDQQERIQSYLKDYPNAIVDRDKAEHMAYASKENEERASDFRKDAIASAEKAAAVLNDAVITRGNDRPGYSEASIDSNLDSNTKEQFDLYARSARVAADAAKWARVKADAQADVVGDIYDKVKNL